MFQDPTAVAVPGGSAISGWRIGGGTAPSSPATALLATGPTTGHWQEASGKFVVTANGPLAGAVTITPHHGGGSGSWSPASATITSGQQAEFAFTPSSIGDITITFTNSAGLANPAPLTYASVDSAPPALDLTNRWLVDANPKRQWGTAYDSIPALGPPTKRGNPNKVRASEELSTDAGVTSIDLDSPPAGGVAAAAVTFHGYEALRRIVDPIVAGRVCYHIRTNKTAFAWDVAQARFRSELSSTGSDRYEPWDTEEWVVCGIALPAYWQQLNNDGWAIMFQWHDSENGMTGNPPIALSWSGGNGSQANNSWGIVIRNYNVPGWPTDHPTKTSRTTNYNIPGPATMTWHYFIFRYRMGCGYRDETGAQVYGPCGSTFATRQTGRTAFVTIYHAIGEAGVPYVVGDYRDFWGSPMNPVANPPLTAAQKQESGYWKCGLYTDPKFTPAAAGDDRDLYHLGWRQYRHADLPANVSHLDILADFKASRVGTP